MGLLSALGEVFGFTDRHCHVTLILLGFLTLYTWGGCFSEYHQKHELHVAGNTIEQHDVYGTFASVLEIMLLAKKQLIKMVDGTRNIAMSGEDCKLIGDGFSFREIHEMNSTFEDVAKLTKDIIVGDQIMVTGTAGTTLVSTAYYVQMLSALDMRPQIDMTKDHALMVVRVGTDLVVTNVDNSQYRGVDLICIISQDYLNIRKIILPSLQELHRVFNDIIAASKI